MKIYAKCPPTKCEFLTSGKEYEVMHEGDSFFHVIDDVGDMIVEGWIDGLCAGGDWERIVRDDVVDDILTVRDRFAMAALSGMTANGEYTSVNGDLAMLTAIDAYRFADAMMEARKK